MPVAQLQFVQGMTTYPAGQAAVGVTSVPVTARSVVNATVVRWVFSLVDAPPGSAFVPGVQQDGGSSSWIFTPDHSDEFVVQLDVYDTFGNKATDVRVFGINRSTGRRIPGFKSTDAAANFGGGARGWSPQVEAWLNATDTMTPTVATVSALRTTAPTAQLKVLLKDYAVAGDGGGGEFDWDATSTAADDGGVVFAVVGIATGRWRRAESKRANSVRVEWWGGRPNANFFNGSNGRWYQDAGLTTEATSDAGKHRSARDFVAALGGGTVLIGAGNHYFPVTDRDPHSSAHEWVKISTPGLTFVGEGYGTTFVRLGPGCNGADPNLGYATIYGIYEATPSTDTSGLTFRGITFDHNSKFNQFGGAWESGGGLNSPFHNNASVFSGFGNDMQVTECRTVNAAGTFVYSLGNYAIPSNAPRANVSFNRVELYGDDPNTSDISMIAVGANDVVCMGNVFDAQLASRIHDANVLATAMEIHGDRVLCAGNVVNYAGTGFISAGDSTLSLNQRVIDCHDNEFFGCGVGVFVISQTNSTIESLHVNDNKFHVRFNPGAPSENGILIEGNGTVQNCHIHGNFMRFLPTPGHVTPTPTNSHGIKFFELNLRNVWITGNDISGLGYLGITIQAGPTPNLVKIQNVWITGNKINDGPQYGIGIFGAAAEGAAAYQNVHVFDNDVNDSRPVSLPATVNIASTTNTNPIQVMTSTPHGLFTDGPVTIAAHLVNTNANGTWSVTVTSPTTFTIPAAGNGVGVATGTVQSLVQASLIYGFWSLQCRFDNRCSFAPNRVAGAATAPTFIDTTAYPNFNPIPPPISRTYAASSAATNYRLEAADILIFTGTLGASDGGVYPNGSRFVVDTTGVTFNPGGELFIQGTSGIGSTIIAAQGIWEVFISTDGNHVFNVPLSPNQQATRVGQLTDSTGGVVSTTLGAGIADAVAKNAIASLAAKVNALEAVLHSTNLTA